MNNLLNRIKELIKSIRESWDKVSEEASDRKSNNTDSKIEATFNKAYADAASFSPAYGINSEPKVSKSSKMPHPARNPYIDLSEPGRDDR